MPYGGPPAAETLRLLREAAEACAPTRYEESAIWRYQAPDGPHERLNSLLRGRAATPTEARRLLRLVRRLDSVLARATLPAGVTVYRGISDVDALVSSGSPLPVALVHRAYLSTTTDAGIAVRDFADTGARGGVLEITAGRGSPGLWLPPVGDPDYAYESEILFARGALLTVRERRVEGRTVVLTAEVTW